jgi:hypothetical protein
MPGRAERHPLPRHRRVGHSRAIRCDEGGTSNSSERGAGLPAKGLFREGMVILCRRSGSCSSQKLAR